MAKELFRNAITKDHRPYYKEFAKGYFAKKLKPTQVQKFVTDNLLTIAKHQKLNERYISFMSIDLDDEEKKKFRPYKVEARKKTLRGNEYIEKVLDEARHNAKLPSDEMFIANRMMEIV